MMKQQRLWTSIRIVGVLLVFLASLAFGGLADKDKGKALEKTNTNDLYRPFLINNIFNYYSNNGDGSFNKFSTDNEGFEFLKGDGKHVIFEDGVVWGGYHKGRSTAKVGGSVYRHGLQAGRILTPGTATTDPIADDASNSKYRVFRVRPDINPTIPFSAVEDKINNEEVRFISRYESYTARDIYDQYIADWNEWPAAQGAPYKDVDTNGVYDPTIDIPGQPGSDQTLWYVSNDMNTSRVNQLSGSPSIGLEMQRTIWGYRRTGALGVTIFASTILINKSGAPVDTMYLVQWADPDLGDAGDDFAGCDVPRSLGYIYNGGAVDATYGVAVPAGGFDFFQGPIVPSAGDSAIFKLKIRKGYKNLPMTAFVFFTQGNAFFADPLQGNGGDIEWYRLMKGTVAKSGDPFIDFSTNQPTVFCLSGDPVTGTGWIDGMGGITAQDRRICLVTGPFRMAAGDTQELVVANLAGVGADRLSSITVMRDVDDKAQSAYDNLFKLPGPPPNPTVAVAQLDGKIILTWGDQGTITKTEGTVDQGFSFEGYKVYEYPGASTAGGILLGTWDIVDGVTTVADTIRDPGTGLNIPTVLQNGTDKGVIRSITLTSSKVTGTTFVNGTPYYFAVTAYSYNPDPPAAAGTHALESSPLVTRVVPQTTNPGVRYSGNAGDTLKYTKTMDAGATVSDGFIIPMVVDPTRVTGHTYTVKFNVDATSGETQWSLIDQTLSNKVLLTKQLNQSGDDNYAIVDGLLVKVVGPAPGMKNWRIPGGTRRFSPVGGWPGLGLEGFSTGGNQDAPQDFDNGTIGMAGNFAFGGIKTTLAATGYKNVLLKLAAVPFATLWDPTATPTDTNFSRAYRWLRSVPVGGTAADPSFVPWIINRGSGYPYQDYNYGVPFSAWNMETTPPTRLSVGHFENNVVGGLVDGRYWPNNTDGDLTVTREFAFIFDVPYSNTPNSALTINLFSSTTPMMWVMACARRADVDWAAGDQFQINANHPNSPATTFAFQAPSVVQDASLAKADVQKVNVFPNPYVGFNPQELNKYARFVTFTHLPQRATLRIFNLSGVLIRTLRKDDGSQYFTWDLNNEGGFPASAGMYFVYIDMPDQGVTKTLKLGLVPEQQYLDRW